MKYKNFFLRAVNLLLILGVLSRKTCSTAKSSSVCRIGRCFGGRRSNICCRRGWWRCM